MPRNKLRLQLALYARPKHPDTYHYALFIAPKNAQDRTLATKHHVKNTLETIAGEAAQHWRYERTIIAQSQDERRLLVRMVIAKATSPRESIEQILESVPVGQTDDTGNTEPKAFTCRTWVRDALQQLAKEEAISGFESWAEVEQSSWEYVKLKQKQRRWSDTWAGPSSVPLMDLLDNKVELVP